MIKANVFFNDGSTSTNKISNFLNVPEHKLFINLQGEILIINNKNKKDICGLGDCIIKDFNGEYHIVHSSKFINKGSKE